MNARTLLKPPMEISGAQYTDFVSCDFVPVGQLLAGYEIDDEGTLGLTHLEANGIDIYLLAVEVPAAIKQIEDRLEAEFWANQTARADHP